MHWTIWDQNPEGESFFSYSKCPDLLWSLSIVLLNGYGGDILPLASSQGMRLSTHLCLALRFRMS